MSSNWSSEKGKCSGGPIGPDWDWDKPMRCFDCLRLPWSLLVVIGSFNWSHFELIILPDKVLWDSDRFAEASKKRRNGKYYGETHLGIFAKPATIVDTQGKILAWYLPGLLLPHQIVSQLFMQHHAMHVLRVANSALRLCLMEPPGP